MTARIYGEIGSCWYDLNEHLAFTVALEAINQASICKANGVKFQLFTASSLYSKRRAPGIYENIKKYELPVRWLNKLSKRAYALYLDFGLSVFSHELVDIALPYVDFIKLASGDLVNDSLLKYVCRRLNSDDFNKVELQLSTGAANIAEVNHAISILDRYNLSERTVIFHCVSSYPSKLDEMSLAAVGNYRNRFAGKIGLSDHTKGNQSNIVAQMAIAAGYTVFEKHVNLSGVASAPDDVVASNKKEFSTYVESIRLAEKIMGDPVKKVQESEKKEREWARRGTDGLRPVDGVREQI